MTEITLNIPDSKLPFFMLLANELDFVVINKKKAANKLTSKQKQWIEDFKTSLHEVDLHTQGKIKLKTAQEFLDEL
jgi:hypothetical protein